MALFDYQGPGAFDQFQFTTEVPEYIPYTGTAEIQTEPTEEERGEFAKGFHRGIDELQALGGGAVGLAGDLANIDTLRDWGYDIYQEQMAQAGQYAPAVESMYDIESMDQFVDWIFGTAGELAPSAIGAFASSGTGAIVGGLAKATGKRALSRTVRNQVKASIRQQLAQGVRGPAVMANALKEFGGTATGKVTFKTLQNAATPAAIQAAKAGTRLGAKRGAQIGVAGFSSAVESGGNWIDDFETNQENTNPAADLAFGIASGMTDLIGGEGMAISAIFGKNIGQGLVKRAGKEAAERIEKGFAKTFAKELTKSILAEGAQEAAQESIGKLNSYLNVHSIDAILTPEVFKQVGEAAVAGMVGGLAFGAVGGTKAGWDSRQALKNLEAEKLEAQQQKIAEQEYKVSAAQAELEQVNAQIDQAQRVAAASLFGNVQQDVTTSTADISNAWGAQVKLQERRDELLKEIQENGQKLTEDLKNARAADAAARPTIVSARNDMVMKGALAQVDVAVNRALGGNLKRQEAAYKAGFPEKMLQSYKSTEAEIRKIANATMRNIQAARDTNPADIPTITNDVISKMYSMNAKEAERFEKQLDPLAGLTQEQKNKFKKDSEEARARARGEADALKAMEMEGLQDRANTINRRKMAAQVAADMRPFQEGALPVPAGQRGFTAPAVTQERGVIPATEVVEAQEAAKLPERGPAHPQEEFVRALEAPRTTRALGPRGPVTVQRREPGAPQTKQKALKKRVTEGRRQLVLDILNARAQEKGKREFTWPQVQNMTPQVLGGHIGRAKKGTYGDAAKALVDESVGTLYQGKDRSKDAKRFIHESAGFDVDYDTWKIGKSMDAAIEEYASIFTDGGLYSLEEAKLMLSTLLPNALNMHPEQGSKWLSMHMSIARHKAGEEINTPGFYSPTYKFVEGLNIKPWKKQSAKWWKEQFFKKNKKTGKYNLKPGLNAGEVAWLGIDPEMFDELESIFGGIDKETVLNTLSTSNELVIEETIDQERLTDPYEARLESYRKAIEIFGDSFDEIKRNVRDWMGVFESRLGTSQMNPQQLAQWEAAGRPTTATIIRRLDEVRDDALRGGDLDADKEVWRVVQVGVPNHSAAQLSRMADLVRIRQRLLKNASARVQDTRVWKEARMAELNAEIAPIKAQLDDIANRVTGYDYLDVVWNLAGVDFDTVAEQDPDFQGLSEAYDEIRDELESHAEDMIELADEQILTGNLKYPYKNYPTQNEEFTKGNFEWRVRSTSVPEFEADHFDPDSQYHIRGGEITEDMVGGSKKNTALYVHELQSDREQMAAHVPEWAKGTYKEYVEHKKGLREEMRSLEFDKAKADAVLDRALGTLTQLLNSQNSAVGASTSKTLIRSTLVADKLNKAIFGRSDIIGTFERNASDAGLQFEYDDNLVMAVGNAASAARKVGALEKKLKSLRYANEQEWFNSRAIWKAQWPVHALKMLLQKAVNTKKNSLILTNGDRQAFKQHFSHMADFMEYNPDSRELLVWEPGEVDARSISLQDTTLDSVVGGRVAKMLREEPNVRHSTSNTPVFNDSHFPHIYNERYIGTFNKFLKKNKTGAQFEQVMLTDEKSGDSFPVWQLKVTPEIKQLVDKKLPLWQKKEDATRGSYFRKNGKIMIRMFGAADKSTFLHETAHVYLDNLTELVNNGYATDQQIADFGTIKDWLNWREDQKGFTRAQHEKFARGFEKYLMTGKAPNSKLAAFFEMVKQWLFDVYKTVSEFDDITISPVVENIYANMLTGDPIGRQPYSKPKPAPKKKVQVKEGTVRRQTIPKKVGRALTEASEQVIKAKKRAFDKNATSMLTEGGQIDYTWFDDMKINLQDYYHPLRMVVQAVKESGGRVDIESNVYKVEEALPNALTNEAGSFRRQHIDPLHDDIKKYASETGQDSDEIQRNIDTYLIARHAVERNAALRRAGNTDPAPSGMSDQDARDVLAGSKEVIVTPTLEKIGRRVDAISRAQITMMRKNKLLPEEEIKRIEGAYRHYVPLKGWDEMMETLEPGYKNRVRGPELKLKAAAGRELGSRPDSPLTNLITQSMDIMSVAYRVKTGRALLKLINDNPQLKDADFFFTVEKDAPIKAKWVRDKKTGDVSWKADSVPFQGDPRAITVIDENGKKVRVLAKDQRVADAFTGNNLAVAGPIIKFVGRLTRGLAKLATTKNPAFIYTNPVRDVLAATINIWDEKLRSGKFNLDNEKVVRRMLSNLGDARKVLSLQMRKKPIPKEWERTMQEFMSRGGFSTQYGLQDYEAIRRGIDKASGTVFSNSKIWSTTAGYVKMVNDALDMQSNAFENMTRLATFKAMFDAWTAKGMDEDQAYERAASAARNITVNFSRRGAWAPILGPLYMFSNASIQGTARMLKALARNPKLRYAVATGGMASALMLAQLGRIIGGDDEDGIAHYDKIPNWVKNTNMIFMIPGTDGQYIKIPLPYGYGIFNVIGQQVDQVLHGDQSVGSAVTEIVYSMFDNFSPIGSPEAGWTTLLPTVLRPPFQLEMNKGFFGQKIMPEVPSWVKYDYPDANRYWSTVNPLALFIAETLNSIGGTTETQKGIIDVSPESIEHYVESYTGGVGKAFSRLIGFATKLGKAAFNEGPELDIFEAMSEFPVIRRYYGKTNFYSTLHKYNEVRSRVAGVEEAQKVARAQGLEAFREFKAENPDAIRKIQIMKAADQRLRGLRKLKNSILRSKRVSAESPRILSLEKQERKIIQQALKQITQLEK